MCFRMLINKKKSAILWIWHVDRFSWVLTFYHVLPSHSK